MIHTKLWKKSPFDPIKKMTICQAVKNNTLQPTKKKNISEIVKNNPLKPTI